LLALLSCAGPQHARIETATRPAPVRSAPPTTIAAVDDAFASIDAAVTRAIDDGKMPGCVVLIGRHDEVLFRRAYGAKALLPERAAMTADTVFDLASLTKPIATATSVMILHERGLIDLDAPASKYVPDLAKLPTFTVRQLLLHTSGLPAVTARDDYAQGSEAAMRRIAGRKMSAQPGEQFLYSDVGYIVLGEMVRRVSGKDLAAFAASEIFAPLGMKETGFTPPASLKLRSAPTELRDGAWIMGDVHDPLTWQLGGVAGNAGVFSTADDLARFAQAMLHYGELDGNRVLAEKTAKLFFARHDTPKGGRALGWDVDSVYASSKAPELSKHAFGHGGFTGTALWIDPDSDLFFVFLSNRVHPGGTGLVNPLVAEIESLALRALTVETGVDVLRAEHFERLKGSRIALVSNASARTKDGTSTIDLFLGAPEISVTALLSPEHGIDADREGHVRDSARGSVPIYSLYGERFAPPADLAADAIVFDLQDAGVRFYTYASTMRRAMKVAADKNLRFIVLDRPNPLGGTLVQGPLFSGPGTFVNHAPLPIRHGMTMGELARFFAAEDGTGAKLEIARMKHWRRKDYFDRTGLPWTSPSPNLRSVGEVVLYPALGLVEGTNVSVGRGTDAPFERLGAPWLDADAFARALGPIAGLELEPTTFVPSSAVYRGETCRGVKLRVTDRARFDPIRAGIAFALALHAVHPSEWKLEQMDALLGSKPTLDAIRDGKSVETIAHLWDRDLEAFKIKREAFLMY
jgi:uncharacterized protein YbbC (DUF1343 family)